MEGILFQKFIMILDKEWDKSPSRKVDWIALEKFIRDVLKADMNNDSKLILINEAVGAYTGRGIGDVRLVRV